MIFCPFSMYAFTLLGVCAHVFLIVGRYDLTMDSYDNVRKMTTSTSLQVYNLVAEIED